MNPSSVPSTVFKWYEICYPFGEWNYSIVRQFRTIAVFLQIKRGREKLPFTRANNERLSSFEKESLFIVLLVFELNLKWEWKYGWVKEKMKSGDNSTLLLINQGRLTVRAPSRKLKFRWMLINILYIIYIHGNRRTGQPSYGNFMLSVTATFQFWVLNCFFF